MSRKEFMELLRKKLASADIENVKKDVLPYIAASQQSQLEIWSNDYFLKLADMIRFSDYSASTTL